MLNKYTQIKNVLDGGSLKNRYRIVLDIPTEDSKDFTTNTLNSYFLNVLCQSANMPDRKLNSPQIVWYRGRKTVMRSIQDYTDTWEISVLEDSNYNVRKIFENWLLGIDSQDSDNIWKNYKTNAKIYQLSAEDESVVFGYELYGVFVSSIGNIEFDDSINSELVKYNVTLSFSKCVPITK